MAQKTNHLSKLRIIIKIIILISPLIIVIWLLNKELAPLGKLELKYDFKKNSPFISEIYPGERTSDLEKENEIIFRKIVDDIVYFDLKLPRSYQKAEVKIKFKNEKQPIFDLGACESLDKWIFNTHTLENKFVDRSNWNKIRENNLILLQKDKKFDSIGNFLKSINNNTKIAFYNYNKLPKIVEIENYQKTNRTLKINHALRGRHTIYTYIQDENLDFTFNFVDINREAGTDLFKINIVEEKTGETIHQGQVEDDGITISSGKLSTEKKYDLKVPQLEKGVYKIDLDINNDILLTQIQTKQNLLVFDKRLYLAQNEEYFNDLDPKSSQITFYQTGENLYASTSHRKSLQTIQINNQNLEISQVGKNFDVKTNILKPEGLNSINLSKSDLYLETDGYFVFQPSNLFNPKPQNIAQLNESLEVNDFDYLIANYNPDYTEKEGWKESKVEFDLSKLYLDKDLKVKFMLSAPGLKDHQNEIRISEIKVTLEKKPITFENFWTKLKNFINKK